LPTSVAGIHLEIPERAVTSALEPSPREGNSAFVDDGVKQVDHTTVGEDGGVLDLVEVAVGSAPQRRLAWLMRFRPKFSALSWLDQARSRSV